MNRQHRRSGEDVERMKGELHMAQKKKNPAGQLADAQNAASLNAGEESKKKLMTSFYIDPDNYEKLRLIASLRTMQGERNHLGQAVSAGMLMNQAVEEYLERNTAEVEMATAIAIQLDAMRKEDTYFV